MGSNKQWKDQRKICHIFKMEKLSLFMLLFCIYVTVDAKINIQIGKDCKIGCPKIRKPVCGSNGKMYDNACLMKTAACKQKKIILPITKCPKISYHVCGSDGKRYNNLCELALASCRTKGGLHRL